MSREKKPLSIEELKEQNISVSKTDLPELANALGVTEEQLSEELGLDDLDAAAGGRIVADDCCGVDF